MYEGAIYHVINRGNYRKAVFGSVGAAQAFEEVMLEAASRSGWLVHGYVIMSNHYHLALTTPQPNLVEGMHWLQSTFSTRFNRMREEQGHLFQGRYKAQVVEPGESLARVVNYIHLNPVRARLIKPEQLPQFRWSSLRRFLGKSERPAYLEAASWMGVAGRADDPADWKDYVCWLEQIAADENAQKELRLVDLDRGWAIGTRAWRQALAEQHAQLALAPGLGRAEVREMLAVKWTQLLSEGLKSLGKTSEDVRMDRKGAAWKVELAIKLRAEGLAPNAWIAEHLHMGNPRSVSVYVSHAGKN